MAPIICLEGPSAVGKTTLLRALERVARAATIPELDAGGAPPIEQAEPWFTDRHAEQWLRARRLGETAPLVVLDGDPLKGLWYNWMHAEAGWPGVDVVEPTVREHLRRGTLGIPDLYVYLDASEAQLRARREGDETRRRRGFEGNLRKVEPQRRYFAALQAAAPERVAFLDTNDRPSLAFRVMELAAALPAGPPEAERLLDAMAQWVRTHDPARASGD